MRIDRETFVKAIEELEKNGEVKVSDIAEKLNVSRPWLYDNFPQVRDFNQRLTDDDVIAEIEKLRADGLSGRITVEGISERLGIVRQTFSRRFRHLYDYLAPDSDVFAPSTIEETLLTRIQELEEKLKTLTEEKEVALNKKEGEILSLFMRKDAEHFDTIKTQSSLKRLQDQSEEHASLAKEKTREVAELRRQLVKSKEKESQGGCEIVNRLRPDYSAISELEKLSVKDISKLFNAAEKRNFELAEEIIAEQQPDYVIFFQPFFACDYSSIPAFPTSGKVVFVESNAFREDVRNEFIANIRGENIIAICAQTTLAKTKLFARGLKHPVGDDFVSRLHENIMLPVLKDGFSAVVTFDPENFRHD
jgi:AraC-like DNA-binding protein